MILNLADTEMKDYCDKFDAITKNDVVKSQECVENCVANENKDEKEQARLYVCTSTKNKVMYADMVKSGKKLPTNDTLDVVNKQYPAIPHKLRAV